MMSENLRYFSSFLMQSSKKELYTNSYSFSCSHTVHIPKYSYHLVYCNFYIKNFNDFHLPVHLYCLIYHAMLFQSHTKQISSLLMYTNCIPFLLIFIFSLLTSIVVFIEKYWYNQWIFFISSKFLYIYMKIIHINHVIECIWKHTNISGQCHRNNIYI